MKETRIMMGMPVTFEIAGRDDQAAADAIDAGFDYIAYVDLTFSTYKDESEIMRINRGELELEDASDDMKEIFDLADKTKSETNGYFDIMNRDGIYDPSGIVKGWAITKAAEIVRDCGFRDYYVEAGGDIEVSGTNDEGGMWSIGIRNPFNQEQIVKTVYLSGAGIATSGNYIRGNHIYDPHKKKETIPDITSLSVIGPNAYEADRFATAAFAMGRAGIHFIESLPGFEGYLIDSTGTATMTSGFDAYTHEIHR